MEPIGYVKSCFPDKFGTPRQPGLVRGSRAELTLRADLQPELALQGIEEFSHLWLIFVFHKNQTARYHAKVHPPRLGGQPVGLFATRTPHRPNALGLSLVQLVEVRKDTLILEGIDLIDGTPVLDVKPYLPEVEARIEARSGLIPVTNSVMPSIEFSEEAEARLSAWQTQMDILHPDVLLRIHLQDVLAQDPRPLVYRGYEGVSGPYRQEHRVRVYDGDVHFEFLSKDKIRVNRIIWPFDKAGPQKRAQNIEL